MYNCIFNQKGNPMTDSKTRLIDLNNMSVQEALFILENIQQHPERRLSAQGHKAFEISLENVNEFIKTSKMSPNSSRRLQL